ncbi:MAG: hypothetical protein AAFV29_14265, partial [Myxococcota bacterium]
DPVEWPRWLQDHRDLPASIAHIASYRWANETPSAPWARAANIVARHDAPRAGADGLMYLSIGLCAVGVGAMVLGIWRTIFMIAESSL